MSTPENMLDFDALDAPESELDATPPDVTPAEATPPEATPEPATPEPVVEAAERVRDPATGRFLPQAPESMPDPTKAAEPTPEEKRVIPLAAHLEERKRLQSELTELRERLARLETPPAPPAPEPDFLEDPKGYVDARTQKALDALQKVEQRTETLTQEQQVQQFLGAVAAVESEYVKQAPDYYDALAHIRAARVEQLNELFPTATREQIQNQLRVEELQAAHALMQQGRNPSEAVYRMAQKVYGYRPKSAAPAAPAMPNLPKAPVGDPSRTLGPSGGATPEPEVDELGGGPEDMNEMIGLALKERFARR